MTYTLDIAKLIVELILGVLSILVTSLIPKVKAWLETKLSREQLQKTKEVVEVAAKAAEQLLKSEDPTGEKRKAYVKERIEALGITVTDEVDSIIESAVLEINKAISNS